MFTLRQVKRLLRIDEVRLYGAAEIQALRNWSRQWTYTVTHRRDFPAPRWKLGGRDIYWADEVDEWFENHEPGEPDGA